MRISETGLPGLLLIEPTVFRDERGFFLESYNRRRFLDAGITAEFVQDNHALSVAPGVLRGFHFQAPPKAQAKLVWVTRGSVLDAVVDLRRGSPTYGEHYVTELSAENFRRLFVPKGFGHAYLTLAPDTEFQYKVDELYAPDCEGGLAWDDPDIGVDWGAGLAGRAPVLSDKDRSLPGLAGFDTPFTYAP